MYGLAVEASSGPDCVAQVQQAYAALRDGFIQKLKKIYLNVILTKKR